MLTFGLKFLRGQPFYSEGGGGASISCGVRISFLNFWGSENLFPSTSGQYNLFPYLYSLNEVSGMKEKYNFQ